MTQLSLLSPPPCPCGDRPPVEDDGMVILWCLCDIMAFDTVTEYQDWLAGSVLEAAKGMRHADQA